MADYFTHFCVELEKLSAAKLAYWHKYEGHKDDDDEECCCFDVISYDDDRRVVIVDQDGHVTMDHVAAVIRGYLAALKIKDPVIVPYANTASRSIPGSFDGGVVVVWAHKEAWLNATAAGDKIAAGEDLKPDVVDYSTALDDLRESTES